ncbi:MAG: glycosyltransferase family 4 protein [Candidatus Cloacimonetes bacterium]|nr:glycosyltransferase family 4 protein [Candidatus Cloacimonadota bacterium]
MKENNYRKVLIITYYWPPAGGPGVQRVLKFVQYLLDFGWQPIVLTVKNGQFPALDFSHFNDCDDRIIIEKSICPEPGSLYKSFTGTDKSKPIPVAVVAQKPRNWKMMISFFIRMNFFIPDAKIGWIPFALHKAGKIIREHKPAIIFTSSPPQTINLIGILLKKMYKLPWIADMRDPWTNIYHYDNLEMPRHRYFIEKKMENLTVKKCDALTTVSKNLTTIISNNPDKFRVIYNGFDPNDMPELDTEIDPDKFIIIHTGKLSVTQNPVNLWKSLSRLGKRIPDFLQKLVIKFIGSVDSSIIDSINEIGLADQLQLINYLPHKEIFPHIGRASLCLVVNPQTKNNLGIIPAKFFEYMALNRNSIVISPRESEIAEIVKKCGSGVVLDYNEDSEFILEDYYNDWLNDKKKLVGNFDIDKFSRPKLTEKLANMFNEFAKIK